VSILGLLTALQSETVRADEAREDEPLRTRAPKWDPGELTKRRMAEGRMEPISCDASDKCALSNIICRSRMFDGCQSRGARQIFEKKTGPAIAGRVRKPRSRFFPMGGS